MRHALALASLLVVGSATTVSAQSSGPAASAGADPREWAVPYGANTRPRDPYADAEGRVWFVGQNGNYIAHLDTRSKTFGAEIPVGRPGPNTIRHMMFDSRTRQIWFGTDQGTIGRIRVPAAVLLR